ncbi:hypothetical protein D3C85_1526870 [compost metagenome]
MLAMPRDNACRLALGDFQVFNGGGHLAALAHQAVHVAGKRFFFLRELTEAGFEYG